MPELGNLIWENSPEKENPGSPKACLWEATELGRATKTRPLWQPRPCRRASGGHGNAVAVVQRLGPDLGAGLGGAESASHMTRGRSLCGDGRSVSQASVA